MAVYDHEEQEQIARLRAWWADYGNHVTAAVVALALAMVGWQGWQWYQNRQSGDAAVLFAALQRAAVDGNAQRARESAGQLISQYGGTVYAELGALLAAKVQAGAGDNENARTQLGWVIEKGRDPALRELARLRLAALQIDAGLAREALQTLANPADPAFAARFADLTGDAHVAAGDRAAAKKAYEAALAASGGTDEAQRSLRELVSLKLATLESAS